MSDTEVVAAEQDLAAAVKAKLNDTKAEPMTFDEAVDNVHYWAESRVDDRDRAFDDLLGWVAGQAIHGDPSAAGTLRRIRARAEHA